MKIGLFTSTFSSHKHKHPMFSLIKGAKFLGHECFISDGYKDCEVACSWGIYKKARKNSVSRKEILLKQLHKGRRNIIMEMGYVKRQDYFSVGFDSQNGWADFNNKNSPRDRWDKLKTPLKTRKNKGNNVLVCGQVPWDTAVQDIEYEKWCKDIMKSIREVTDRKIIFRPHPCGPNMQHCVKGVHWAKTSKNRYIEQDFKNAWCVVAYNSNSLVEAAIEGIPIFSFNDGAMTREVSNKDISAIENPKIFDLEQWAANLAYTQWNREEMLRGEPIEHLLS